MPTVCAPRSGLLVKSLVVVLAIVIARPASAEPLPSGSIGAIFGGIAGTGADASRLGVGTQTGGYAAWQPMTTDRKVGWALRWSCVFGYLRDGDAARIDDALRTVHMDFTAGLRYRPAQQGLYLTLRAGVELLRANEPIPPMNQRAYVGPMASVGIDKYAFGSVLFSIDIRYALIANGPSSIGLLLGAAISI